MSNDYYKSDEFKSILNKYEASREQGESCYLDAEEFADVSDFYLNSGKAAEALEAVNNGIVQHPENDMLKSVKSGLLIFMHRYAEAREIVNTLADDANGNDVFYQKAQLVYAYDDDVVTAEEMFREWISLEEKEEIANGGTSTDGYMRESYIHVITSFIELGPNNQYDEEVVKRWIEEYIVTFDPLGNDSVDFLLGDIVREEMLNDMVVKIYTKLLEVDPYMQNGWTVLAMAQSAIGRYTEAVESCDFALAISATDWEAKLTKAYCYYTMGELGLALPLFEESMDKFKDYSLSLPYAYCLISMDRYEEAMIQLGNAYEYAQTLKDVDVEQYVALMCDIGEGGVMCNGFSFGNKVIDEVLQCAPDESRALFTKGTLCVVDNQMEAAMSYYMRSLDMSNDKISQGLNIAMHLILNGSEENGLLLIDECEKASNSGKFRDIIPGCRALAYYKLKRYDEFLDNLKLACVTCPSMLKSFFTGIFPKDLEPEKYYSYFVNHPLENM